MAPTTNKLTSRSKRNTLKCCVWNVNGIKTKSYNQFEDDRFLRQIKGYDVMGLVESHLTDSLPSPLNKYKTYHNHTVQEAKSKRSFGGIIILVKNAICKGVSVLKPGNSNYQWVKFDKAERFITMFCACATSRLEIEVGRYTIPKIPVSTRTCKQCDHNFVENEHLLE